MKYRIIDDHVVAILIDFLDDIQLDAAEDDDLSMVNFLSDIITELINSDQIFDSEQEAMDYMDKSKTDKQKFARNLLKDEIEKRKGKDDDDDYYQEYFKKLIEFAKNNPIKSKNNLSREELKKLYNYFSKLHNEVQSRISRIKNKDYDNVEEVEPTKEDITKEDILKEKFEKFYSKRELEKESKGSKSLIKMVKDLGLDLPDDKK